MRLGARLIILMLIIALFSFAVILSKLLAWDHRVYEMLVQIGIVCTGAYVVLLVFNLKRIRRRF